MNTRKNIMQRGNLVVFSFAGTYHVGWVIGQERDGTYAILDESHIIRKHIFANHPHSNFTVNQKLTKQFWKTDTKTPLTNFDIPDIAEILRDDTIEGWGNTMRGIDYNDVDSVDDMNGIDDDYLYNDTTYIKQTDDIKVNDIDYE